MDVEQLADHGIPDLVVELIRDRGITELTEVQRRAIEAGILDGKHAVIAAPTSAGKTLLGELIAVRHLGKGLLVFLVSHKALARQVYGLYRSRYVINGTPYVKVGLATGDEDLVHGEWSQFDVVIATYEKFYSAVVGNETLAGSVTCIVADELQILGDEARGVTVEFLLARLKFATRQEGNETQFVALSATVPNSNDLAEWMEAEHVLVSTRWPPLEHEIWLPSKRIIYTSLNRIENEQQNVSLETLETFCIRLNCDIADLFPPDT